MKRFELNLVYLQHNHALCVPRIYLIKYTIRRVYRKVKGNSRSS